MPTRKHYSIVKKRCRIAIQSAAYCVLFSAACFELTACGLATRTPTSLVAGGHSEKLQDLESEGAQCSENSRSEAFQAGKKRLQALVAGTCVAVTVFQGISQAQLLTYSNSYLRQFKTSCMPWGSGSEVFEAYYDQLLAAPEISMMNEKSIHCESPEDALYFDVSKGLNPAGLFVSRLLLATLTGVAQFHPDQKLAIPAKYLHWYLSGKGGAKVIDEPELVREMELAIAKVWKRKPAARGKLLIGYGDYEADQKTENSIQSSTRLPEGLKSHGAHTLPAAFNSLGRAAVNFELIPRLESLKDNVRLKSESIENYKLIVAQAALGKFPENQAFLLLEINDPYTWPAYGGRGNSSGDYDQEKHGKRDAAGEKFDGHSFYPSNNFPNALVTLLKILLQDSDDLLRPSTGNLPSSATDREKKNEKFSLSVMGNLSDGAIRAMLGAGAKDFQMVKRWLMPVSLDDAYFSGLDQEYLGSLAGTEDVSETN